MRFHCELHRDLYRRIISRETGLRSLSFNTFEADMRLERMLARFLKSRASTETQTFINLVRVVITTIFKSKRRYFINQFFSSTFYEWIRRFNCANALMLAHEC